MKIKGLALLLCLCMVMLLMVPAGAAPEAGTADHGARAEAFYQGILSYELRRNGARDVQDWIDGALVEEAGISSEWYVMALSQSGSYDFSRYESALLQYLAENTVSSAASREKYALTLSAVGSTDVYIAKTTDEAIGKLGIMSLVFGLHLLNNGYVSAAFTTPALIEKIRGLQKADGGWAVMGDYGDVDVTAMTIQALGRHYESDEAVRKAVDSAVSFLEARQSENGTFKSYGKENAESTVQVLMALATLGIDGVTDERFIQNGQTLLDALDLFRRADGSFAHLAGGEMSLSATSQVFYGMVAYRRMLNGQSPFYIFDGKSDRPAETLPGAVTTAGTVESDPAGSDPAESDPAGNGGTDGIPSETPGETRPAGSEDGAVSTAGTDGVSGTEEAGGGFPVKLTLIVGLVLIAAVLAVRIVVRHRREVSLEDEESDE